jgi:hypothetical protein
VLYRHDQYIAALAGEHVGWFLHEDPAVVGAVVLEGPGLKSQMAIARPGHRASILKSRTAHMALPTCCYCIDSLALAGIATTKQKKAGASS